MKILTPGEAVIGAGWLIDGTGGPILENVLLRMEGGIIESIDAADASERRARRVADYSDYTLMPGLVDAHVHLFISGSRDPEVRKRQLDADFDEVKSLIAENLKQHFSCGITAVRDAGDYGAYALKYKEEGQGNGAGFPVVKVAGTGWRKAGRYGRLIAAPPARGEPLADAVSRGNRAVDHVKIIQSGVNSLLKFGRETKPQFSKDELEQAVRAAHGPGLKVMIHCNGREPVKTAIKAGCDSVEHGFFMGRENLKLMAETGVFWVPTAVPMKACSKVFPKGSREADVARKTFDAQLEQIRRAGEIGVKMALGTDSGSMGVNHGFSVMEEFKTFMDAGLSIQETVKTACSNGAELLGLKNAGRIAKGMSGPVLAFKGSPDFIFREPQKALTSPSRSVIIKTS